MLRLRKQGSANQAETKATAASSFYSGFGGDKTKVSPTAVLVFSFGFIAVVVILHIAAKFKAIATRA